MLFIDSHEGDMFAKKITISCLFVTATGLFFHDASAQDENDASKSKKLLETPAMTTSVPIPEQYGGVVVDQTTTGFGRQFYQHFVSLWQDNPLSERYMIAIRERATARFGSQITIEYAQRRIYQTFLPPSTNAIRTASENAVGVVYDNIVTTDVQRLMFRDEDLGADEI